eukprot:snap_masked-scaffold2248_size18162-processed-gene-0.1 protein:Tk02688 transcript:snap_masked-scaffold2248_size18162-processed-gene-0.1-mRNA-1 annotation:"long-chain specific acyl- mitochondrial precursor"
MAQLVRPLWGARGGAWARQAGRRTQSGSAVRLPPCQMDNLMDIGSRSIFNEDHDLFRENVRRFMRDELAPRQAEFEERGMPSAEIWAQLGQQGLLGTSIRAEVGGVGGTFKDEAIVLEEQAYAHCASPAITVHSTIVLPYFQNYGTPEQQAQFIPDLVAGQRVAAIGMTEPDAGSDLQGIRTHAQADGDDFILNGSKVFITNGIVADVHVIVAVTDASAKSKAHGISLFIVEDGMPGFTKGQNLKKMGLKGQDTAELFLEDVRVPKSHIIGGLNRGFYQLMHELPQERLGIAITSIAACEWMFETTRDYVINRQAFGRTLSALQTVQHRLAELKTATATCRSFIDECIHLHEHKLLSNETASMAKYWSTDLENRVAAECVQLHGGWGYMWETPIARSYVNARVQTIYGGTNEIMKELIARSIVKK